MIARTPIHSSNAHDRSGIRRLAPHDPQLAEIHSVQQAEMFRAGRSQGPTAYRSLEKLAGSATLYALKPRFQMVLRPLTRLLAGRAITANQVTGITTGLSIGLGLSVVLCGAPRPLFLLLPLWLSIRMALNTIDGMLACEFSQKSALGVYLNELGDVLSDAALCLPLGFVPPFSLSTILIVVFLGALSEFAGALGPLAGAARRYDGPLGKSDRAFLIGALGLWIGIGGALPEWLIWLVPLISALLFWTTVNRVRRGIEESQRRAPTNS